MPGQNRAIDSLLRIINKPESDTVCIKTLGKLSWEYTKLGQFDDARKQSHKAIDLVNKLLPNSSDPLKTRLLNFKGLANNDLGINAYYEGNYPEALASYLEELKIFSSIGDKRHMAISHGNIGLIYKNQGNYPQALKEYYAELGIADEINNKMCKADAYGDIGEVCRLRGAYEDALKNDNAALKLREEIGDKSDIANSYCSLSLVYSAMKNYLKALKNDSLAVKLMIKSGNTFRLSTVYMDMASEFDNLGNDEKAMELYKIALKNIQDKNDRRGMTECYVNMSWLKMKSKQLDEARSYLQKAIAIGTEIDYKDALREAYNSMAIIDSLKGDYKNGWKNFVKHISYRDSLFNENATRRTTQVQMQYEFDKKEHEARVIQDKKDLLASEEKERQTLLRNSFIGGFVLTSLLGVVIFNGYRRKKKDNALLSSQNQVIIHQKELVEEKQKEIIDSINYAKRLQEAILPTEISLKTHLPGSFVLYKPKDIVAGDFYWMEKVGSGSDETIFIAAADCTGHGVPGALVSVVCSGALNRALLEFGLREPGKILDKAAELVKETFSKSEADVKDGMDISLLSLRNNGELSWAGAFNPLWYLKNGTINELAADKQPVGKTDHPKAFTTHHLKLEQGDHVYLFTDGFADQFGGPKGKKFKYKPLQDLLLKLAPLAPQEQKNKLDAALMEWKGELEQVDDICIIGIRI